MHWIFLYNCLWYCIILYFYFIYYRDRIHPHCCRSRIHPHRCRSRVNMKIQDWIEQPDHKCFRGEDSLDGDSNLGSAQNCLQEIIKVVITVSISKCGGKTMFLIHVLFPN